MRKSALTILLTVVMLLVMALPAFAHTCLPYQDNVAVDKVWKITFNRPVDKDSLRGKILIVNLSDGSLFNIRLTVDPGNQSIVYVTHVSPFDNSMFYSLSICQGVRGLNGKAYGNMMIKPFCTDPASVSE